MAHAQASGTFSFVLLPSTKPPLTKSFDQIQNVCHKDANMTCRILALCPKRHVAICKSLYVNRTTEKPNCSAIIIIIIIILIKLFQSNLFYLPHGKYRRVQSHLITHNDIPQSVEPLDEGSARGRTLYLTTHTRHSQQTDNHAHGGIFSLLNSVCTPSVLRSLSRLSYILHVVFTYNAQHKHPCRRRDSNPQSLQATDRRPSPQTARPLRSASLNLRLISFKTCASWSTW